ncbi:MAG: TlpA disulfide reductase family protein [Bacteroidales bacterium]|nr:TlpA disulfide reductase family protein [Bacteroidales bacterium]
MPRKILTFVLLIIAAGISAREPDICKLSFQLKGHNDSFISLAYHMGERQYIKDTIATDGAGNAFYNSSEPLGRGLYMVVFPDNSLFEIIIADDQQFTVYCDRNDIINTLKFSGSEENSVFLEYRKKWMDFQEKASQTRQRMETISSSDSMSIYREKLTSMEEDILAYIKDTAGKYEGSLLSSMLASMLPVQVPEFDIPLNVSNRDSLLWIMGYNYNKEHFFDNVRLDDPGLIRTPIMFNKLNTFFSNVLIQAPDSIIPEIRKVVGMAQNNRETYRYVIAFLFNHFRESQIMGHDAIVVMLADEYYFRGDVDWVSKEFLDNLKLDVASIRPSLIGKKATDITIQTYSGVWKSLYDIKSEFTILYFWEPNCGHCKAVTPELRDFYRKNREKGIEVFAICTQNNKEEWEEYIAENELEWINGWDPARSSGYDFYYNVKATPLIYVLNADKEIIAKKLPSDRLEEFIDSYRKMNR